MSKLIDFNLNRYIHVKLTNEGRAELKRQSEELQSQFPNHKTPYIPPKEDDDGFSKWQGWILISKLGHLMHMGCPPPFEIGIKFEVDNE